MSPIANIIEIVVRARTDDASFDEAKAKAATMAAEADAALSGIGEGTVIGEGLTTGGGDVGTELAAEISQNLSRGLEQEAPAVMSKLGDDSANAFGSAFIARPVSIFTDEQRAAALNWMTEAGSQSRAAFVAPLAAIPAETEKVGEQSGAAFTGAFQAEAARGLADVGVLGSSVGSDGSAGTGFAASFSKSAKSGIQAANIAGILGADGVVGAEVVQEAADTGAKAGAQLGKATSDGAAKAAKDAGAGGGMSPIILGLFGAAASVGPALILAGMATAMVGVTGLVLKSNATIAADYVSLGHTAETAIKTAVAPLAGDMNQALTGMKASIVTLTPQLKDLFAGAAPDIGIVATGIEGFAGSVLPGMSAALSASQADVAGFAAGLTPLGAGVGSFFTGLTKDSATTGAGIQSVMGVLGNTMGTLGTVVGSASSAISTDLMAVDPVINTLLTTVRGLSSPATIGGLVGAFGAMKLDPAISSGLASASTGMMGVADKAAASTGVLSKFSGAALGSASALDSAAGVMAGPWGIAIGAAGGVLSGLIGSMIQARSASDALTLSQQGLTAAVAQDGGQAGQATTAYIAQSAAADGLTTSASAAGVSVTTWTSAVLGNQAAQQAITTSIDNLNASQHAQVVATDEATSSTGKFSDVTKAQTIAIDARANADTKLSAANQQVLASMTTQAAQVASTITQQTQLTAATIALGNSTTVFNATLALGHQTMVQSATSAGDNAVAALNLGDSQTTLNQKLAAGVTQYQLLQGAASGYKTVLDSLNGSTMTTDQAQNTLAGDMITAATSFKKNKESLDLNTQAGVSNRTALVAAATAIQALGIANINAGGNVNTANAIIQQQATAFVNATGATGKQKLAIEQYLAQIDQLPPNVTTTVTADVSHALASIGLVGNALASIGGADQLMIRLPGQGHAYGGVMSAAASGGARGDWTTINEQGQEAVRLPNGSLVMPHANTMSMLQSGGGGGSGGGTGTMTITVSPESDSAVATMFMRLVRENKIQLKMN